MAFFNPRMLQLGENRKLECRLSTTPSILMACAKLHNYVIDCQFMTKKEQDVETQDGVDDEDDAIGVDHVVTQFGGAPLGLQYLPILPDQG